MSTPLDATITRLPKNRTEGHIPRMALTTGGADPLQCLLRKIGLDDSEFGVTGSDARIHLYKGGGFTQGALKDASGQFSASVSGGAAFPAAEPLWSDTANLNKYDVVLLSCEGDENLGTKPRPPRRALQLLEDRRTRLRLPLPLRVVLEVDGRGRERRRHWAPVDGVSGFNERTPPAVPSNPATRP